MRPLILCFGLLFSLSAFSQQKQAVDYVNPFIGTDGHGHTYPGATVPFGMVQLSPDNGKEGWDWCSGYHKSEEMIAGFSHTHLSGTGCADLGDILFLPSTTGSDKPNRSKVKFTHSAEKASAGYYSVKLSDGILVELTATERVGVHRYTYPTDKKQEIFIDLGYGNDDTPTDTYIRIENQTTVSGYRVSNGWSKKQKIYFTAKFSRPITENFLSNNGNSDATNSAQGTNTKALLRFSVSPEPLLVKVGISATSCENALKNLELEAPLWDFEVLHQAAKAAWQKELSQFDVSDSDEARKETFFTSLYHTMLAPTLYCDADGSYRGADGEVHTAANFKNYSTFSLWDTYRAAHPLYTLIAPNRVSDMVNSCLTFFKEHGQLPIWTLQGWETECMIGYHSVPVIADAYAKGFTGFDINDAYAAMKATATQSKKGLQFYGQLAPRPLDSLLASYTKRYCNPTALPADFVSADTYINGWSKTIKGEQLEYHSAYPGISKSRIVRAGEGTAEMEWETSPLPTDYSAENAVFMFPSGLASGLGGHKFDLFINGEKYISFTSYKDTTEVKGIYNGEKGTALYFQKNWMDEFNDYFGTMYVKIPVALLKKGKSVRLKIKAEDAASRDFCFLFEGVTGESMSVNKEFILGEKAGKTYQLLRIDLIHLQAAKAVTVSYPSKWNDVKLYPGLNTFFIPVENPSYSKNVTVSVGDKSTPVTLLPSKPLNYIPSDKEHESVSKCLEYAYDDWCIAQVAKSLGKTEDYVYFSARADFFKSIYDPSSGFMRGKTSNGNWVSPFNPKFSTHKQPQYTEGNAWQYTWSVQHDVPALITLMGGKEKFRQKLDTLFFSKFDLRGTGAPPDVSGLIGLYAHGNEPSHHIAYLYKWTDTPGKTEELIHKIGTELYSNKQDGLCGNEDCGQMSAWYVFSTMGFYPVNPADGNYILGAPLVEKIVFRQKNNKLFTMETKNFSPKNIHVKQVLLNGANYTLPYIKHSDITSGATLTFVMEE